MVEFGKAERRTFMEQREREVKTKKKDERGKLKKAIHGQVSFCFSLLYTLFNNNDLFPLRSR